jgi:predicted ATP-binding protein involved in virulence
MNIIKRIEIASMFHKFDVAWNLHPDVNILIGINGSGKSTILRSINALLSKKYQYVENLKMAVEITLSDDTTVSYSGISGIAKNESGRINHKYIAFPNYRLKAINYPKLIRKIHEKEAKLFDRINRLFAETEKTIEIDPENNTLFFRRDRTVISLDKLSSGEKQLLMIIFSIFLTDEKPCVLLMDEPELSLHVNWQQQLIDMIRGLNPNCQTIIATHSPSIFGEGWGDKLFFVEDLIQ